MLLSNNQYDRLSKTKFILEVFHVLQGIIRMPFKFFRKVLRIIRFDKERWARFKILLKMLFKIGF